jgi:hypothetical protein
MKLTTYAWIMAAVVFVGTLPHAVGAMFLERQIVVKEKCTKPFFGVLTISEMKKMAKWIAKGKVLEQYKSTREWKALLTLWDRESRWDYTANNPRSTAYGIPQILRMPEDTPMLKQIDLGLKYIKHRYGSPTEALAFHNRNGWY